MKMRTVSLSGLCLLGGLMTTQVLAQDATATGGGVHCQPVDAPVIADGTRIYTQDSDLSQAGEYPALAKVALIEGQAQVDCQVGNDGRLNQCLVTGESRPGYGLGQALAVTVVKWAQTDSSQPGHAPGDWLRFTTNWKLPGGAPAQQLAAGSR